MSEPSKYPELLPEDLITQIYNPNRGTAWSTTPSHGVHIRHRPTGIITQECSDRSVHKNKAVAYDRLKRLVSNHYDKLKDTEITGRQDFEDFILPMLAYEGRYRLTRVDDKPDTDYSEGLLNIAWACWRKGAEFKSNKVKEDELMVMEVIQ